MAGRPRKPTAVLEASGAFEKDPQRKRLRSNEPTPNGPIGDPPDYFDEGHRAVWSELCATAPPGVLAKSDGLHLEITTRLLVRMRRSSEGRPKWLGRLGELLKTRGYTPEEITDTLETFADALQITPGELRILGGCLVKLGMTPSQRIAARGFSASEEADPIAAALGQLGIVH